MSLIPRSTLGRRLAVAGILLLALALAWVVWAAVTANSFSARIAAIRAAGDPASISDLLPKPIPPEQDAAAQLAEAKSQIDAFARDHGRFFNTPVGKSYNDRKPGEPLSSEQLSAIRAILDRYADIDAAVSRAAACEQYASRMDFTLPHAQFIGSIGAADNRTVARYVRWQMEVAMAEERHEDAVQQGINMLRLSRLIRREPSIVGGMVAAAIHRSAAEETHRALDAGPISAGLHDELDSELARHDDLQHFVWTAKSERAVVITGLQENFRGIRCLVMNTLGRPLKMHYTAALDLFDSVLKDADKPWHLVVNAPSGALSRSYPQNLGVFADQLQPTVREAYKVANRSLAVSRCLRIANALHRFEKHQKREAKSLAELPLPRGATIDPFSGGVLLLKRHETGWKVYSVGENGKDDGGVDFKDYGLGVEEEVR